MGFMSKWTKIGKEDRRGLCYIPYKDSEGNLLQEEEILFINEEIYSKRGDTKEKLESYTIASQGIELLYDEGVGNFPIALLLPDGRYMYLKISAKTGEVLPVHAGCCPSIDVIYTGSPSAGKTVNVLQIADIEFHNMMARNTKCSLEDDLPPEAPARRLYEEAGRKLKKDHILPDPTPRGKRVMPYIYYLTNDQDGYKKHVLLRIQDIDGQECIDMPWDSIVPKFNQFFLTIGADELFAGESGQYARMIDRLISRLRVLRTDKDYELVVIITKCDLLKEEVLLKDAFQNSVKVENGVLKQEIHEKGFDYRAFRARQKCIINFLQDRCPRLYNVLINTFSESKITFCMIASIGEKCENNTFKEYKPFCIDEPILAVLAKRGMYPIAVEDENLAEGVETFWGSERLQKRRKKHLFHNILDSMRLPQDLDVDVEDYLRESLNYEDFEDIFDGDISEVDFDEE